MTSPLLHFKCYDRKGREGDVTAATYDLWIAPEHVVAVRAGFMRDDEATRSHRRHADTFGGDCKAIIYSPDVTRSTITMVGGDKHMVEGPPHVNVARINRARAGVAEHDSVESKP